MSLKFTAPNNKSFSSHTHTHVHKHSHRPYNPWLPNTHARNFQQLSRNTNTVTSAEDVHWDAVARLGFPPWDWLWLAHMLMLGCLSCLSFSPQKIICSNWASDQAFHHLLTLEVVVLTKKEFRQSAKTDCHNTLVFNLPPPPALPDCFLRQKHRWLVAAWENWKLGVICEWFIHSIQWTASKREWRRLGVHEPLWLQLGKAQPQSRKGQQAECQSAPTRPEIWHLVEDAR